MKERLILVGGGGHCRSCIDVIEAEGRFVIAGIIEAEGSVIRDVAGYPVIGTDKDLRNFADDRHRFLVTVGQIESSASRKGIFDRLVSLGASLATVFAPSSIVSNRAKVGRGTIVMHHAIVNSGAVIGENCIVNTKALVEHDASIGDHCHVSTAAAINGGAAVAHGVFLGSGCVVGNHLRIGRECVIGAGSVVLRDITEPGAYAGSPARRLRDAKGPGQA